MRVIMMGTGPFAVPTLEALYASRHEVLALVTRPPRPLHGKSRAEANPMRELAAARGTRVHEPEDINAPASRAVLASYRPDLFVVCDYGQILSPSVLEVARYGGINLHASLLPKYRGAAPINWAIYHGERETGVTVIHMTARLDAGPAIGKCATPIRPDETTAELEPRLAALGAPAVLEAIDALEAGTARPIEQDATQATPAPRLKKEHGAVDWTRPAAAIANQVRALVPWPKTFSFWHRTEGPPLRLILERVHVDAADEVRDNQLLEYRRLLLEGKGTVGSTEAAPKIAPGTVIEAGGNRLVILTGAGALAIDVLQPAGKRALQAEPFMHGYNVRPGDWFGAES
jgi:methionyl-tRNA formyltransferase